jgi:hypothetical protein
MGPRLLCGKMNAILLYHTGVGKRQRFLTRRKRPFVRILRTNNREYFVYFCLFRLAKRLDVRYDE